MNLNRVIGIRLPEELYKKLENVSRARGESASSFARRAIKSELGRLSFLTDEEKKALGLKVESENVSKTCKKRLGGEKS
ncbi:ribbon-helix-helix protein, CopG family [Candidatus Bathyarchaeota archaeon]|nr:ribbon-helix-helix protein, CopG family [Candidatus Bathyarchaeota archaeon]